MILTNFVSRSSFELLIYVTDKIKGYSNLTGEGGISTNSVKTFKLVKYHYNNHQPGIHVCQVESRCNKNPLRHNILSLQGPSRGK